jgi:hypothetical protein
MSDYYHSDNFDGKYDAVPIRHLREYAREDFLVTDIESLREYAAAANTGSFYAIESMIWALFNQVAKGPESLSEEALTILWVTARLNIPQLITRAILGSGARRGFHAEKLLYIIHLFAPTTINQIPWNNLAHGGFIDGIDFVPDPENDWCGWARMSAHEWKEMRDAPSEDSRYEEENLVPWRTKLTQVWDAAIARAATP